jgi:hypothetical protein
MEPSGFVRLFVGQLGTQQFCEETVVTVHRGPRGHRLDEGVGPLQHGEDVARVAAPDQRLGQLRGEFVDDAGPQQEFAELRRLGGEDLAQEVFGDVRVVAGDAGDESLGVNASFHGHREQPQADRPPLGAFDK